MHKKEIKKLEKDKSVTHCYITKGGYYRPNHCGYTDYRTKAGVYPKHEAIEHALHCEEILLIPIDKNEHNKLITDEVKDLLSRII